MDHLTGIHLQSHVRVRDNAAAWTAVQEGRAAFLVDRPDAEYADFSRAYHDRLFAERVAVDDRLRRLFTERAEHHRHVDTGPDADWAAEQFEALAALAGATDARFVADMLDRWAALSG